MSDLDGWLTEEYSIQAQDGEDLEASGEEFQVNEAGLNWPPRS